MKKRAAVFFLAMLIAPLARAQSNDDAIAKLKAVGDERMHDLHFREALEQYDAAMKLGGGAAIQYNRARALQGLGDYPRALDALEEFVRTAPPDLRARVPQLDELIADLRGHVATLLIVVSNVEHATIRVGHDVVGTTPINVPVRVSVGHVVLEASAPGWRTTTREMTLSSGETRVDLALDKVDDTKTTPVTIVPVTTHASVMRPAAIVVGAVGLGGLALGAIFGGLAVSKRSDLDVLCPDKSCDATGQSARSDAWTFATVSTVGLVSGAVLLAGGAVMFLLAPRASKHIAVSPFGIGGVF